MFRYCSCRKDFVFGGGGTVEEEEDGVVREREAGDRRGSEEGM